MCGTAARALPSSKGRPAWRRSSRARPADGHSGTTTLTQPIAAPPEKPAKPASLADLMRFASVRERLLLLLAAVTATATGVAYPGILLPFSDVFSSLGDLTTLDGAIAVDTHRNRVLYTMFVIAAIQGGGTLLYYAIAEMVCQDQLYKIKSEYLKAILRQEVAWYDTAKAEELLSKFLDALSKVEKGFNGASFLVFEGMFGACLGGYVMAFVWQAPVAAVTLATLPTLVVPALVLMYFAENGAKLVNKAYASAGGIATEALYSMRTVASLGIERTVEQRYSSLLLGTRRTSIFNATALGVSLSMALSGYVCMMLAGVVYGGLTLANDMESSAFPFVSGAATLCADSQNRLQSLAANTTCPSPLQPFQLTCQTADAISRTSLSAFGFDNVSEFRSFTQASSPPDFIEKHFRYFGCPINPTDILLAVIFIMLAGEGLSLAGPALQNVTLARQAVATILDVVDRAPTIDALSTEGDTPSSCRGDVELRDVTFAYPAMPDRNVCNGYSLRISAGMTCALCGPSGAGKSTIIQLIERFYDPMAGAVLLDGIDIRTLNVRWLRAQLGLVGQEPVLFQGSVAVNIGYGMPHGTSATQADIEEAAKLANAHTFIMENLSDGYNTDVGLRGGRLSGGQKQRVAIARALIKKPAVLLLDEATSALDNESERVVQAAIDALMSAQKRTTIVIAHRLSTIRHSDSIAVVNGGRVVEQGTHDELLALEGQYFQLALAATSSS